MNAIAERAIEAMDFLVAAVEQIPSESWDQPSNLDGWSIRDLVVHTTGTATKLLALAGGETEATDDLQQLAARLKDALAKKDPDTSLSTPIVGLTIHGWDIHRSQHQPVEVPDDLLAFCRQVVEAVPEDELRRPGTFGPAKPAPEDATPTARFMAYVGRSA
ncbi:maleylpyruvate isomerase N-terminal domain-containing protein [Mycobacterium sp.]|uniref:maleylpyruvate isomerase N-terminal domain-containing protein n=1 Tax=Mycobacterium sp. TaxID=1785 RepID=UPI003BAF3B55